MGTESWGVLVAGLGGYTGNTFALGVRGHQLGLWDASRTLTHSTEWKRARLPTLDDLIIGGWDCAQDRLLARARIQQVLPPAVLELLDGDEVAEALPLPGTRGVGDFGGADDAIDVDAVANLRSDIRSFKERHSLSHVVVIIALPPELPIGCHLSSMSARELVAACSDPGHHEIRASMLYVVAALLENCRVIDFTANASLELPGIADLATEVGVSFAGRDGSTGETALKLHLADFFRERCLQVNGWYGTNILGNDDGRALMEPERRTIKMADKKDGLAAALGYAVDDHSVSIDFHKPRGDNKEFWDVVDVETWLGGPASLRLNWIGPDSLLAGQLLCDLSRIMASPLVDGRVGVVPELGYFFKHPLGTSERSLAALHQALRSLIPSQ